MPLRSPWTLAGIGVVGALVAASLVVATGPSPDRVPLETGDAEDVDRQITVAIEAIECPPGYDNQANDDVCLAYDGQIPGHTFVFDEGQRVELTLEHRVEETIANLDADPDLVEDLVSNRYSLHRHGVSVTACHDGVARPIGTQVCESTVGPQGSMAPDGSITYTFETAFPGVWHYHDHSLGLGVGTDHGNEAGPDAEHRGLWGAFRVVPDGETTNNVFDLHLLDSGPNGGLGLDRTVETGERFELLATGLGDYPWTVQLENPNGVTIWTQEIGPGLTRGYTVDSATEGTYEWTAQSPRLPGEEFTGEVVAR
jgi:FtsP/CotA-like multicopper oxidase with cupredoxin domain